jgi:hypothetical protein
MFICHCHRGGEYGRSRPSFSSSIRMVPHRLSLVKGASALWYQRRKVLRSTNLTHDTTPNYVTENGWCRWLIGHGEKREQQVRPFAKYIQLMGRKIPILYYLLSSRCSSYSYLRPAFKLELLRWCSEYWKSKASTSSLNEGLISMIWFSPKYARLGKTSN